MPKLKAKPPEEVTPGHSKGLLFGKPGAGKTWFALNFPSCYFIDTEGGANLSHYLTKLKASGGVYLGPDDGSCDFDVIIDEIKTLATEKHGYKTLVIDSVTKVFQSAIAREAERLGSRDAFGASKKPAVSSMRRLITWIDRLDMNFWAICHEISEWGMVGGERKEIGKMPDCWDKFPYEMNLCLRVENLGPGSRTATVTKSRLKGFPEFDRLVLQDGSKDLGYQEFAARYGKDYIEADTTQIVLASRDQVAEIDRLTGILKIDDAEIEKILTRAGAEAYAELTDKQAASMIEWLMKKIK